jgi:phosphopantothenoylcysteine synthetase/decarboxylase
MSESPLPKKRVLYIIVCGAPPAARIGELVELARHQEWDVYLIPTPQGCQFIDTQSLEQLTGHPVVSDFRQPDVPKGKPEPDAIIVAPATFNTINKWALGIADNNALSILCENMARQIPIAVYPMMKNALAQHPAYRQSLRVLKSAGIHFRRRQPGEPANGDYRWTEVLQLTQ